MHWKEIRPGIFACLRADSGANIGLIHAKNRWILVDTAFCALDLLEALDETGIVLADLHLAFNTHFHADHTWGNQLLAAPILGHRRCRELMEEMEKGPWSREGIDRWLGEVELSHPEQAERCRQQLGDLRITPPGMLFDDRHTLTLNGFHMEFIHLGGHTSDLSVLWLPEQSVLFASDLVFEGRYPYLLDADVPAWIEALETLRMLGPETIVPGHGKLCDLQTLDRLRDYLLGTWERCAERMSRGVELEALLDDPAFPRYDGPLAGVLHKTNIRYIHERQTSGETLNLSAGA